MCHPLLNRLITTVVLCSLLLQGCKSGLHAIIEKPVARQEHPTTADHVRASDEALPPDSLAFAAPRIDARVMGTLGSVSLTEPATAVASVLLTTTVPVTPSYAGVYSVPQSFVGPFTASSGERVLFSQQRGQWQAVLQGVVGTMAHGRALPVVGSGDIGASLKALQGQDAWSSRSRIHVLSAPHTLSTPPAPCIYVGKLGLLGGAPTQQTQSPAEEWIAGPTMTLGSDATSKEVYHIPPGYRYKGHRLKAGSVIRRACLTIHYVAAHNEEEYCRLGSAQDAHTVAGELGANVGQVVTLDTLEGDVGCSAFLGHRDHDLRRAKHAGLVLYGSTKKNRVFRPKSMMNIQVEILLEKEDTPLQVEKQALLSQTAILAEAFGAREWTQYFGSVEAAPSPPSDIDLAQVLNSPCPFWAGKVVKDTHLLVLIPATVDGKPFSLNLLGELIQRPKGGGHSTRYDCYDRDVQEQFGAQSPTRSYWVLMTRDVLEGSRSKDYASQKDLVACHASRTGLPYELPSALEAATAILSHYVRSGERLYADAPWTYTRCQELVAYRGSNYPAVVGGFAPGGIDVDDFNPDHYDGGVSGLRKF